MKATAKVWFGFFGGVVVGFGLLGFLPMTSVNLWLHVTIFASAVGSQTAVLI